MGLRTVHATEALRYTTQVEATWDPTSARANRGPAILSSVMLENGSDITASMNLYAPMVMLSDPQNTQIISYAYRTDGKNLGDRSRTADEIITVGLLPFWALQLIYIADVIVLNEGRRNCGLGMTLLLSSLRHYAEQLSLSNMPVGIGVTENPAMLRVIEKLGGKKSSAFRVLELARPFTPGDFGYRNPIGSFEGDNVSYLTKYDLTPSNIVYVDFGVRRNGKFELGFTILYHDDEPNKVIAVAIPERRIDQLSRSSVEHTALVGQMLVLLSPTLSHAELAKYERELATFIISHRWGTLLQQTQQAFNGSYITTNNTQTVFELPIVLKTDQF